jgi:hypothetical protein
MPNPTAEPEREFIEYDGLVKHTGHRVLTIRLAFQGAGDSISSIQRTVGMTAFLSLSLLRVSSKTPVTKLGHEAV